MSNTLKIVARVRERTETGTDYAVAKLLEIHPSNFRRVMAGRAYLGPVAIEKAAKLLGVDPYGLTVMVNEDRAKKAEEKAFWRALCPESVREALGGATTAALIFAVFSHGSGTDLLAYASLLAYPQSVLW